MAKSVSPVPLMRMMMQDEVSPPPPLRRRMRQEDAGSSASSPLMRRMFPDEGSSPSSPLMRRALNDDGSSPSSPLKRAFLDEGSSPVAPSSPLQHFSQMSISPSAAPAWLRELKSDERGLYLIHLLLNCANHVTASAFDKANVCLDHISQLVASDGDAMQRVAAHFTDALARRILRSWQGIYRALSSPAPLSDSLLARRHFFDLCPFLKLASLISNQAIMEAMEGERMVHIVDLGGIAASSDYPAQWLALLQTLGARPGGPPFLRITAVNEHKELLDHAGMRLSEEAERLDIPFQFHSIVCRMEDLDVESLRVKTGEALAINSLLQLHCLLTPTDDGRVSSGNTRNASKNSSATHIQRFAQMNQGTLGELLEKDMGSGFCRSPDSVSSSSPPRSQKAGSFLAALCGLSPKVMVVTEQESNHNASTLSERFTEALNFYAALFDCLESTVPRASVERARVEKMLLGEEIKNIIVCDGAERRERHERLERWAKRLEHAGFGRVPLSYYGVQQAKRLLQSYGRDGYGMKEDKGSSFICWQERPLYSVSAWSYKRF